MLGVALLPGLLCAGIGYLVFVGLDSLTGLGTFSLALPNLPSFTTPTVWMFLWALVIGWCVRCGMVHLHVGGTARPFVHAHRLAVTPVLGIATRARDRVLRNDRPRRRSSSLLRSSRAPVLVEQASTWTIGALVLLVVCKALAYGLSLSAFVVAGLSGPVHRWRAVGIIASHLPGMTCARARHRDRRHERVHARASVHIGTARHGLARQRRLRGHAPCHRRSGRRVRGDSVDPPATSLFGQVLAPAPETDGVPASAVTSATRRGKPWPCGRCRTGTGRSGLRDEGSP